MAWIEEASEGAGMEVRSAAIVLAVYGLETGQLDPVTELIYCLGPDGATYRFKCDCLAELHCFSIAATSASKAFCSSWTDMSSFGMILDV